MSEQESIEKYLLNTARRTLAIMEIQAAGYGSLSIPPHLLIQLEDKRLEVANLEKQLENSQTHTFTGKPATKPDTNYPEREKLMKVFLCHSTGDKPVIRELYRRLKAESWIQPWLDEEDLIGGQDWNLEIRKAIRNCHAIVVCLSNSSVTKEGYVNKEIKLALDEADKKPEGTIYIIPLRLDECSVPMRLGNWHWINFYEEQGYEKLLKALRTRYEQLS